MRKIILTGAVLAMLTSAAPMVHAQIDPDVQAELNKKVNQQDYNDKIKELEGKVDKANGLDKKIDNIGDSFNQYQTQNNEKVDKKLDKDKLQGELTKQRQSILGDVDGKIKQAKDELEGKINENKKLIQGDDGNGGLKGDIKKLQDAIGKDHKEGLRKEIYDVTKDSQTNKLVSKNNKDILEGVDGKGGLKKDFEDLKKVVGKDATEGLQQAVKENANNITQADTKAESAKDESAAASRLALEVKQKIDAMANGQNDVKKDIAELGGRINVTGAMSAALAGLKPLQYDPMAPTQVMGSASTYEGQQAYALGLAHFTSENLMVHGGVSFTNSHKYMANVGVTYKFGHSAEKSMIPMRYQAGPISSIYIMQKENEMMREKMAQQEERIAQLEEMIMNMKK
ncbi:YadA C-terminal domain-containing protein [Dialister micraerophilus]|uniref:YadA C-terminal domain-containing protein n=1 Tax=Dialister micraerophilus TaxID=309120 RepID=UPI0023F2F55C|nr:YadA C-terminal domain-containing protein [Dialister micraerophilus]